MWGRFTQTQYNGSEATGSVIPSNIRTILLEENPVIHLMLSLLLHQNSHQCLLKVINSVAYVYDYVLQ